MIVLVWRMLFISASSFGAILLSVVVMLIIIVLSSVRCSWVWMILLIFSICLVRWVFLRVLC